MCRYNKNRCRSNASCQARTSLSSFWAVGSVFAFDAAEYSAEAYRPGVPNTAMGGCGGRHKHVQNFCGPTMVTVEPKAQL